LLRLVAIDDHLVPAHVRQSVVSGNPHAAIARREKGVGARVRQALAGRKLGDRDITKPVESLRCPDPDVAFPILEDDVNAFAGQAVASTVRVDGAAMDMNQPGPAAPKPQAAVAIDEGFVEKQPASVRGEALPQLHFPVDKAFDATAPRDQKRPVLVFRNALDAVDLELQREEVRRFGL